FSRFEPKRLFLEFFISSRMTPKGRNRAALGSQLGTGLLPRHAIEIILALAQFGVRIHRVALFPLREEDDPTFDFLTVVSLKGIFEILGGDVHPVTTQLAHRQLRTNDVLFPLEESLVVLLQDLV